MGSEAPRKCRPNRNRSCREPRFPKPSRPRRSNPPGFANSNHCPPCRPDDCRVRDHQPTGIPAPAGFSDPQTPPPHRGSNRVRAIPQLCPNTDDTQDGASFCPKKIGLSTPDFSHLCLDAVQEAGPGSGARNPSGAASGARKPRSLARMISARRTSRSSAASFWRVPF